MEEVKLETIVQLVAIVGVVGAGSIVIIQLLFKIINVYLESIIAKVRIKNNVEMAGLEYELKAKNLKLSQHPFWTVLYNYLNNDLPYKTHFNSFKTKCAKTFIEVTWVKYEDIMKQDVIGHEDLMKLDSNELYELLMKGYKKLTTKRTNSLREMGMHSKIIEVFERNRREEVNLILNLYQKVINSKLYINNVQKIWAILDLQSYFLQQMSDATWLDIIGSNGELDGLSYDGITNDIKKEESEQYVSKITQQVMDSMDAVELAKILKSDTHEQD